MAKIWLVARHQFLKEVSKRSFIFVLLCLPLFLLVSVGFGFLVAQIDNKSDTLGYVDLAGIMVQSVPEQEESGSALQPYETREEAMAALEDEQIGGFYIIPAHFQSTHLVELVYQEMPPRDALNLFRDTIKFNLLSSQPELITRRAMDGAEVTIRATALNREYAGWDPAFNLFLPLILAAIFAFLVMTTSGYLTEVIVDEKENRTIEIVVTSLSTGRMMTGKILGAVGIALVQFTTWIFFIVAIIWFGGEALDIGWLQSVNPVWNDLLKVTIVALPTYLCIAALMTLIGSSLLDNQEANQVGMLSLIFMFGPIYAFVPLATNPNGALALALTFFPTTGITTVALRSIFMEVPLWQILVSAATAFSAAIFLIWLTGKTFRLSMLRYGQRLTIAELFGRGGRSGRQQVSDESALSGIGLSH